ncbi:hypothetical protein O6H91_13G030000 [Diphasiastrum complanatum]|uniref:Uncharacterized protein n=1 Tax=Diphasiastrum complanatum TaxID=34168 RepID=A0ACC2BTA6_DIPCM|nr:hypothetical protein O6H91_13G030000 [Diphasiastrum complanatum]
MASLPGPWPHLLSFPACASSRLTTSGFKVKFRGLCWKAKLLQAPIRAVPSYANVENQWAERSEKLVQVEVRELQQVKNNLLQAVSNTGRGLNASSNQRALIEEIMVDVERYNAGVSLDLSLLHGTWLLQYTTAPDVISILQAAGLPFFQVGQIFQKFDCLESSDGGTVLNVVRWSIPGVLQDIEGATLTVTAGFSVVSSRNIQLHFKENANVLKSDLDLSLSNLSALCCTFFVVLQFLRTLDIRVPLGTKETSGVRKRASVGLLYYLTYLDRDMLLGRALGNGGEFIFSRTQALHS